MDALSGTPHSPVHLLQSTPACTAPALLIIDDEPLVLHVLQVVCQQRGFVVWTASTGPAGIELFRQHRQHISLVLLDVRMPGLDGPATLSEIQKIDPGVRACFMSGHLGEYTSEDLQEQGALGLFSKPFKINDLIEELWGLAHDGLRRSA